jgi:hypothetical protein
MTLLLIDRSNYFKGLLVLSRRDRVIDARERNLLLRIGRVLDFDKRFCESTINELLMNANISREPVIFTNERLKEAFFRDALQVAFSDEAMHPAEYRWLRKTAKANGWTSRKLGSILREFRKKGSRMNSGFSLEIQKLL